MEVRRFQHSKCDGKLNYYCEVSLQGKISEFVIRR
jgi:hypothetical protein